MDERPPGPDYRDECSSVGEERDQSPRTRVHRPARIRVTASAAKMPPRSIEKRWGSISPGSLPSRSASRCSSAMRGVPQITDELRENLTLRGAKKISHSSKGFGRRSKKGPLVDVSGLKHLFGQPLWTRALPRVRAADQRGLGARVQPEIEFLTKNGSISVIGGTSRTTG